jgi:hypothetical protein
MHVQILKRAAGLTPRYVANAPHFLGDADETHRMGGTGQPAGMLSGQLFGPGGNTIPSNWIDGRPMRAARRRHSGKGRAVPVRCPSIP